MRTRRVRLTTALTALTVAAIVLAASTAQAAGPAGPGPSSNPTAKPTAKLDKAVKSLLEAGRDGSVPVVVRYEEGAHDRVIAKVKQKGGTFKAEISTSSFRVDIQASRIIDLAQSTDVAAISLYPSLR